MNEYEELDLEGPPLTNCLKCDMTYPLAEQEFHFDWHRRRDEIVECSLCYMQFPHSMRQAHSAWHASLQTTDEIKQADNG